MNVEQRQVAADPQNKPHDLGCKSACRLLSSTTTIAIYYYYSARKLILIYRPTEGRRLSWLMSWYDWHISYTYMICRLMAKLRALLSFNNGTDAVSHLIEIRLLCRRPHSGSIKRWCASDVCPVWRVCLFAYIGPKLRTERPRKTKIDTEIAHVTRDSDTTFKVKRSKVNLQGRGHIVAASRTACKAVNKLQLHCHLVNKYDFVVDEAI